MAIVKMKPTSAGRRGTGPENVFWRAAPPLGTYVVCLTGAFTEEGCATLTVVAE